MYRPALSASRPEINPAIPINLPGEVTASFSSAIPDIQNVLNSNMNLASLTLEQIRRRYEKSAHNSAPINRSQQGGSVSKMPPAAPVNERKSVIVAPEKRLANFTPETLRDIAELMLRTPGSFNNQLGDHVPYLLINSGALPRRAVISVRQNDEPPNYIRAGQQQQSRMPREIVIELRRTFRLGDDASAHYNLIRDGVSVTNAPDGECLYRAISQGLADMDIQISIEQLRSIAADELISHPARYLGAIDRDILDEEYQALCEQRSACDGGKLPIESAPECIDIDSLSSSASHLSIEEGPSAKKPMHRQEREPGISTRLAGLLRDMNGLHHAEAQELLDLLIVEQVVKYASTGIMSGEAEKVGGRVIHSVAEGLLDVLRRKEKSEDEVFRALFPDAFDDKVVFVNALPIIMHLPAGLRVMELMHLLSKDPALKETINVFLHYSHVANRAKSLEYINAKNFFERVKISAGSITRMTLVDREVLKRCGANKESADLSKVIMDHSIKLLEDSGFTRKSLLTTKLFPSGRMGGRPMSVKEVQLSAGILYTGRRQAVSEFTLQKLQQLDYVSYSRFLSRTLGLRSHTQQVRTQSDAKSSQSYKLSTLAAVAALGASAQHSVHLARARNAEKDREWETGNEAGKVYDRAVRDNFNERGRLMAPNLIGIGFNLALDSMHQQERQLPSRPSPLRMNPIFKQPALPPESAPVTVPGAEKNEPIAHVLPRASSRSSLVSGTGMANLFDVDSAIMDQAEGMMDNLSELDCEFDREHMKSRVADVYATQSEFKSDNEIKKELLKIDYRDYVKFREPEQQQKRRQLYGPLNANWLPSNSESSPQKELSKTERQRETEKSSI